MSQSRRKFLRTATAAVSAPFILPSRVWSADTPPNSRITLGFIGTGMQGLGLLGGFLGFGEVQVVSVCDVDTNRRNEAQKRVEKRYSEKKPEGWKGVKATNDFREITGAEGLDGVVIATPDHWHAIISVAAVKGGKDVYCEKPLTHNIHEAVTIIKESRAAKRVLQTGSMQRSSAEFRIACELVRNGVIGEVKEATASFGAPGKPCDLPEEAAEPGLDWDRWLGPAQVRPYNSILAPRGVHNHFPLWREYTEFGGGYVTDWGAHHLDIIQWALGMDESGPVEAIPAENAKSAREGGKLVYANGVTITHKGGTAGALLKGTLGEVEVGRGEIRLALGGEDKACWLGSKKDKSTSLGRELAKIEKEYLAGAKVQLYKSNNQQGDFLKCMGTREKPICDVETGARSAIACHLLNFTYNHGAHVKWDPAKNEFAGGTGDPAWLTRNYRGEWKV